MSWITQGSYQSAQSQYQVERQCQFIYTSCSRLQKLQFMATTLRNKVKTNKSAQIQALIVSLL